MDRTERHRALSKPGVIGIYTDGRTGELVVQHDGTRPEATIRSAVDEAANRYEAVPGGFAPRVDRTARHRPVPLSVSISAQDVTAGTAGGFVTRDGEGPFIDTNLHVAGGGTIQPDEREDQPGEYDQIENGHDEYTEEEEKIGELDWYVDPKAQRNHLSKVLERVLNYRRIVDPGEPRYEIQKNNVMIHDVGHIRIDPEDDIELSILGVDAYPERIEEAPIGELCQKAGRTTGVTEGELIATDWTGTVREPWGFTRFEHQGLFEGQGDPMSKGGDSGSWIYWDDWSKATHRLFAGNQRENVTIGNPLAHFRDEYDVSIYHRETR